LPVVLPPLLTQHAADLADRAPHAQRLTHRVEHVLGATRGLADPREPRRSLLGAALRAHLCRALELAPLRRRIDRLQLDRLLRLRGVLVHADDHALALLDLLLPLE